MNSSYQALLRGNTPYKLKKAEHTGGTSVAVLELISMIMWKYTCFECEPF